ncbi:MAG: lipase family protein [Candidatus Binatia bacterium]
MWKANAGLRIGAAMCMALLALLAAGCGDDDGGGGTVMPGPNEPYSASLATELCLLSLQAYQQLIDFEHGQPFTLPAPYTVRQQYDTPERYAGELGSDTDAELPIAFVATAGQTIYVVFRGTQTITEWIDDAEFGQVAYDYVNGGGRSEAGFTAIYETVHEAIVETVEALIAQGGYTTLYVTGHSLGAALATLAAPELEARTTLQPQLYNFASPRVGNLVFAPRYNALVPISWRVVNTNDVAPTLPPTSVLLYRDGHYQLLFYDHVDSEERITFGNPVTSPLDVHDIEFNHAACNYYATLCEQTADPAACKQKAAGVGGCT